MEHTDFSTEQVKNTFLNWMNPGAQISGPCPSLSFLYIDFIPRLVFYSQCEAPSIYPTVSVMPQVRANLFQKLHEISSLLLIKLT